MPLTIFIPDLLPVSGETKVRLPALERWLARADAQRQPGTGQNWLLRQWGLGSDAPVAAIMLAAEGGPRDGSWMRADPVHQQVEGNALVLHDASVLGLERAEVDAAIDALNDFLLPDRVMVAAPAIDRWYALVPDGELPAALPLEQAVGRNPFGMLPRGRGKLNWPSIFSEVQMLLAAQPFNQRRDAEGRPQLNGLWFWGGGTLPESLPRPFHQIATAEPLARSLALASGSPVAALPATIAGVPDSPVHETLVVLDALSAPRRGGDRDAWTAAARQLERDWFAGLADSLRRFGHLRVVLPGARDTAVFEADRRSRWRLLRRARPLRSHA